MPEINATTSDLREAYLPSASVDGELLFYLTEAHRVMRPSVAIMLAGCCRDEDHFLECIKPATMAFHYPTMAEGLAGEVMDTFDAEHVEQADHAYNLVMIIAQEAVQPDHTWQSIASVVRGVDWGCY